MKNYLEQRTEKEMAEAEVDLSIGRLLFLLLGLSVGLLAFLLAFGAVVFWWAA